MSWFVYALYNYRAGEIYIGQTTNLERRVREHNEKRGKHFTAQRDGEWKLVYKEKLTNKTSALKREKQLKSYQGRQFIKKLIFSPVAQW